MPVRIVEDLMLPLDRYPRVSADAVLSDALAALRQARQQGPLGSEPARAVLVVETDGAVSGKISLWAILRALDPRLRTRSKVSPLVRTDMAAELLAAGEPGSGVADGDFQECCRAAAAVAVRDVMLSTRESVEATAPIGQAVEKMVLHRAQSLLVTRGPRVVGIIRLSDVAEQVMDEVLAHEA
ncbi:MAG: CBS domain-containing protein [Pseudomonadota bacterium]